MNGDRVYDEESYSTTKRPRETVGPHNPAIASHLDEASTYIDDLERQLARLLERIEPIMGPGSDSGEVINPGEVDTRQQSPLAQQLEMNNAHMRRMIRLILAAQERIEI